MKHLLFAASLLLIAAPSALAAAPGTTPTQAAKQPKKQAAPPAAKALDPAYFGIHKKGKVRIVTDAHSEASLEELPDFTSKDVSAEVSPGDKRLPASLRKLTHLRGISRKGPVKLAIAHFVYHGPATLIITLDGPPKKAKSKYLYFPPQNAKYKGGLVKRAGVGKKPSKPQFKRLSKSIAAAKISGENEEAAGHRGGVAADMYRKKTNFYDITIDGKPARLSTLRLPMEDHHNGPSPGMATAGVVIASMTGAFQFALQPFNVPDRHQDGPSTLVYAFVDIDGDGTDEVIFRRAGEVDESEFGTGIWSLNGGKPTTTYFSQSELVME